MPEEDQPDGLVLGRPTQEGQYGMQLMELRGLMEKRGHEAHEIINEKYNGVVEMCKLLYTSPHEGNYLCMMLYIEWVLLMIPLLV